MESERRQLLGIDKVILTGCLLFVIIPLLLFITLAIQGTAYFRCLVVPIESSRSLNPFFNIWPVSIVCGVIIAPLMTYDNWRQEPGLKKATQTFLQGFFGGLLLGFIAFSALLPVGAWVNARFDNSPTTIHQAVVMDKIVRSEKFARYTYLVLADWPPPGEEQVRVCTNNPHAGFALKPGAEVGTPVQVAVRAGFFGMAWVEEIEAVSNVGSP